eukprot:TRINITY_DN107719_c0_g1_i1.p1 TRINITY_DN107719_c0_g1~~TRINITY_DN107719_c0_g1_i1.p1  ORF type:complete len:298 (-),score=74.91 TRINITY_DN107719_c0_g1_i1:10-837(-)
MPRCQAEALHKKLMSPGLVLPVGALAAKSADAAGLDAASLRSSQASTAASTPSSDDVEVQKQKEIQQALQQQRRQLYEKKFQEQHLNRSPRQQQPLKGMSKPRPQGLRKAQRLAELQQKGQALLSALSHMERCTLRNQQQHSSGSACNLEAWCPDQEPDSLCDFMPELGHADLGGSPVQPTPLSRQTGGVSSPCVLGSKSVAFQPPPGLGLTAFSNLLPTLLRGGGSTAKPYVVFRPPPGLEAPCDIQCDAMHGMLEEDLATFCTDDYQARGLCL